MSQNSHQIVPLMGFLLPLGLGENEGFNLSLTDKVLFVAGLSL